MAGMVQRSQRFLKHSLPSLTEETDVNLVREGKKTSAFISRSGRSESAP